MSSRVWISAGKAYNSELAARMCGGGISVEVPYEAHEWRHCRRYLASTRHGINRICAPSYVGARVGFGVTSMFCEGDRVSSLYVDVVAFCTEARAHTIVDDIMRELEHVDVGGLTGKQRRQMRREMANRYMSSLPFPPRDMASFATASAYRVLWRSDNGDVTWREAKTLDDALARFCPGSLWIEEVGIERPHAWRALDGELIDVFGHSEQHDWVNRLLTREDYR